MKNNSSDLQEEPIDYVENKSKDSKKREMAKLSTQELQRFNLKQKESILNFCFRSSIWMFGLIIFLIVIDIVFQKCGLDDTIVNECFSLLKYVISAALGYIFASNTKQ